MSIAGKFVGTLVVIVGLLAATMPDEAWGRAGGGMSSGSRGSQSYSSPSRSYSAPSQPTSPTTQPFTQPQPMQQTAPAGGFWRSMAGGLAGGLLGGMLFRSLGFGGAYGGGFGMFDLLLLIGIGYLIFSIVRRSRTVEEAPATGYYSQMPADSYGSTGSPTATLEPTYGSEDLGRGLAHVRQMDARFDEAALREWCSDSFFRFQAAWMHRDLEKLRPLLTEEMQEVFRKQIEDLRSKRQINKLENIAVRSIEVTEAWQEQGLDYITVRYLANLLDYTVDETSGKIVSGSDGEPVKFEEFWTWVRPVGPNAWRLSAINQAG
ncbi:MAG: Tim44 domain-containing protein [Candidatus Methylomirabilales bacterium]